MAQSGLYRQHALQQQTGRCLFNQGLALVSPGAWLAALIALAISAAGLIIASFISVPITVAGRGILLEQSGVGMITADTEGRIVRLRVAEGAAVRAGDVVAEVAQADVGAQLTDARLALRRARTELASGREAETRTREARRLRQSQRQAAAERQLTIETQNLQRLTRRQAAQEKLAREGFLSPMSLIDGEQEIIAGRRRIDELREPIEDAEVERRTREAEARQRITELELQVRDGQRRVAEVEEQLSRTTHIVSRHDGIVANLRVDEGDVVDSQTEIATLVPERNGKPERLVAFFFVPGETGTQVQTGMTADVVPTSISPEEYGYMRGTVARVSALPVSVDDLEKLLRNRDLAQQIMQSGVPIQMEVDLESARTRSGYRWTSSSGPSTAIGHGTQLGGRVEVRRDRLITVVLPFLKRFFP